MSLNQLITPLRPLDITVSSVSASDVYATRGNIGTVTIGNLAVSDLTATGTVTAAQLSVTLNAEVKGQLTGGNVTSNGSLICYGNGKIYNSLTLGSQERATVLAASQTTNRNYTIPDYGADAYFTMGGLAGTYVPAIRFGGASVGVTYSTQEGFYQVIGGVCFVTWRMVLTSKGSSGGSVSVTLPFAARAGITLQQLPTGFYVTGAASFANVPTVAGGASVMTFQTSGSTTSALTDTNLANTSELTHSFHYFI